MTGSMTFGMMTFSTMTIFTMCCTLIAILRSEFLNQEIDHDVSTSPHRASRGQLALAVQPDDDQPGVCANY
jgi:hypothetical protein